MAEETKKYHDEEYRELQDEFEQIRTCLGMYISKAGTEGAFHLFKEMFNNGIDELVNPNSTEKKVLKIFFEESSRRMTIEDRGRGIPHDILANNFAMKKHISTKYDRTVSWARWQTGRNGVGSTVVAALCDYMSVTSYRGNSYMIKEFKNKTDEIVVSPSLKSNKEKYGTTFTAIPSEKYLGKIKLTSSMFEDYLRKMSYIMPEYITIEYIGIIDKVKKEESDTINKKYKYTGLSANIEYLSPTLEFDPVVVAFSNDNFDIEMAFGYDKTISEPIINSYGNFVATTEGGTHEVAAMRSICNFLSKAARDQDPNNKFEVIFDDCRSGLIVAVNARHMDPAFEGQHKSRMSNKDILEEGTKGLNDALKEYFKSNNSLLGKIISYLRQISKIRQEANKIKGVKVKAASTFLDDANIKGFYNISDRNYTGYKELYLAEGDSAITGIRSCRNAKHQALLKIQGVMNNTIKLTEEVMTKIPAISQLISVIGCGFGKTFDITKLRWDKIIIATDADIDGSYIASILFVFFLKHMPELLFQGKIYRALPPLYILGNKSKKLIGGKTWVCDKKELYDIRNELIVKNIEVAIHDEESDEIIVLDKIQLRHFLQINEDYLIELDALIKRTSCSPDILEYALWYYDSIDHDKFINNINKVYPEIKYDSDVNLIYGSNKGEEISLIVDSLFIKIARRFTNILYKNSQIDLYYKSTTNKEDTYTKVSIGKFLMDMYVAFQLPIEKRLKGLGESGPEQLFLTITNPKLRRLKKLTIRDMEETNLTFDLLHGYSKEDSEGRRNLLENAYISYSDIDN